MFTAKDLIVKPIAKASADSVVKLHHYSGKVCQNSQISFGVFIQDKLIGALQFGPSIDKRRTSATIGCKMNEYLELNRMALAPDTPKNSESRVISVCLRMIKKNYPHIRAILSFADGCQCGDGTIYRASGFILIDYKKNNSLLSSESGEITFNHGTKKRPTVVAKKSLDNKIDHSGRYDSHEALKSGKLKPLFGLQYKYVYFFDELLKSKFKPLKISDVPEEYRIYKGQFRAVSKDIVASDLRSEEGGETPTTALHNKS